VNYQWLANHIGIPALRQIFLASVAIATTCRIACAYASPDSLDKDSLKGVTARVAYNWKVSDKLFFARKEAKEWLLQKDSSGRWSVTQEASKLQESVEAILIDWDRRTVYLNVAPSTSGLGGSWRPDECTFGLLATMTNRQSGKELSNDRKKVGLTVCNSEFTASSTRGVGAAVSVLSAVVASRVARMVVKTDELEAAIRESRLLEAVESGQLDKYRTSFSNAQTSEDWNQFIRTYARYDPDLLLTQAIENRDRAKNDEDARRTAAEAQRKIAQTKADEEQSRYEEQRRRQLTAQVEAFRRSLTIETETNCGPVVEIKGTLVKVYFPVANYGNEHWVRKELLFPPQWECRFYNGGYQPPPLL
jgi:hypothetical protein